jgi:integrase
MKVPKQKLLVALDPEDQGRYAVLTQFKAENIQHMGRDELLAVKILAGHGDQRGYWSTPKSMMPSARGSVYLDIDFSTRLRAYLAKEEVTTSSLDLLVEEGVLAMTRIALLMRLVPAAGRNSKGKTKLLKASSIAGYLYCCWPQITARAIRRKVFDPTPGRLFQHLTDSDVLEFTAYQQTRIELQRLHTLVARGVWSDAPPLQDIRQTTNPAIQTPANPPKPKSVPYQPIPDEWLAEIGPRVLWVVEEMGPNLLRLIEDMPLLLGDINWTYKESKIAMEYGARVCDHLKRHPWLDRFGKPLLPPFKLTTSKGLRGTDPYEWPPRNWEQTQTLCVTLQSAHLFITLLCSAGRIGEVSTLKRDCVDVGRDGKNYLKGFTYKLSGNLFGDARTWPAPPILARCVGQQARLVAALDWLPRRMSDGLPGNPRFDDELWVSVGISGLANQESDVQHNQALLRLARRLDMDPMPGGKNVHPHRFRKTIGRLAGVALFNSPLVLKRLFGHKSIEMTLHYILCDPGVRENAEKVLRELRIMHCAEALEEIHQALRDGAPLPAHGGAGAARLVTTVRNEDEHLKQLGRVWGEGSAYDLAYLLTGQGKGWRFIAPHVLCIKDWICRKPHRHRELEIDKPECDPGCENRYVQARHRRDTELNIESYIDIACQARDDGQLLVLAHTMENLRQELGYFADLRERYLAMPEVQALFALVSEPEEAEAAA